MDKLAKKYLKVVLGGNMNISTLKLKFWTEVMTDFAKAYHEAKLKEEREDQAKRDLEAIIENENNDIC